MTNPSTQPACEAVSLPIVAWRSDDHGLPHVALTREGLGLLGPRYGYALTPHAPAQAEIERLTAENERLREDAERYRWLREHHRSDGGMGRLVWYLPATSSLSGRGLDTAIDTALKAQAAEKGKK